MLICERLEWSSLAHTCNRMIECDLRHVSLLAFEPE